MEDIEEAVHSSLLAILDDVVSALESENVPYYLVGGCALGQVRHNGHFVPWDDDIDIAVDSRDTERIDKALSKLDPEKYKVCFPMTPEHSERYYHIEKLGTTYLWDRSYDWPKRISLEIFPMYRVPEGLTLSVYHTTMYLFKWFCVLSERVGKKNRSRILKIMRILDRFNDMLCNRHGDHVEPRDGFFMRDRMPWKYYGTPTKREFEGKEYCFPEDMEAVLRHIYGDYMQLPPVEKRHGINDCKVFLPEVDFDEYVRHRG